MAIFAREAFLKARLFALGEAAGISDRAKLARAVVRWILSHEVVTSLVLGVAEPEHLAQNLEAAESPELTDEDEAVLDTLRASPGFEELRAGQHDFFVKGWG